MKKEDPGGGRRAPPERRGMYLVELKPYNYFDYFGIDTGNFRR